MNIKLLKETHARLELEANVVNQLMNELSIISFFRTNTNNGVSDESVWDEAVESYNCEHRKLNEDLSCLTLARDEYWNKIKISRALDLIKHQDN